MVATIGNEGFGSCSNYGECERCAPRDPARIHRKMNRDLIRALWNRHREALVVHPSYRYP